MLIKGNPDDVINVMLTRRVFYFNLERFDIDEVGIALASKNPIIACWQSLFNYRVYGE